MKLTQFLTVVVAHTSLRGSPVAKINEFLQRAIEEGERIASECQEEQGKLDEQVRRTKAEAAALRLKSGGFITALNSLKSLEERLQEQLTELHEGGAEHYCSEQHKVFDQELLLLEADLHEAEAFANTTKCDSSKAFVQCTELYKFRATKSHRRLLHHAFGGASFLAAEAAGFVKHTFEEEEDDDDEPQHGGDRLVKMYKEMFSKHKRKHNQKRKHLLQQTQNHYGHGKMKKGELKHHKHKHKYKHKHHPLQLIQEELHTTTVSHRSMAKKEGRRPDYNLTRVLWDDDDDTGSEDSDKKKEEEGGDDGNDEDSDDKEEEDRKTTTTSGDGSLPSPPRAPPTNVMYNMSAPQNVSGTTSMHGEAEARCALRGHSCAGLKDGLMSMVGEIGDEVDNLKAEIHRLSNECELMQQHHHHDIQDVVRRYEGAGVEISHLITKKTQTEETLRLKEQEYSLGMRMKAQKQQSCEKDLAANQDEQCGLRDSRQFALAKEGTKGKDEASNSFAEDCILSAWEEGECSHACGTSGEKLYTRRVMSPNNAHGVPCGPLRKSAGCNRVPCPLDCRMGEWQGWGQCTAQCGGGVKMRSRSVIQESEHGGLPCPDDVHSEMCNLEPCDDTCVWNVWSPWSECTRVCFGFQRRTRAERSGLCHEERKHVKTEQWQSCNNYEECEVPPGDCQAKLDIVFLLDASGSVSDEDFNLGVKFMNQVSTLVKSTNATGTMIVFGGPSTVGELRECENGKTELCGITVLNEHLEELPKEFSPKRPEASSGTNLPGALTEANNLLAQSRMDAQGIAVVLTDGNPNSKFNTNAAAERLRQHSRLLFVVAGGDKLDYFHQWASQPVHQNLRVVPSFEDLASVAEDVAEDLCPIFGE